MDVRYSGFSFLSLLKTAQEVTMSLVPAFEIGLWNAWIPMLYFPLHPFLFLLIDKLVGVGDIFKKMKDSPNSRAEKILFYSMNVFMLLGIAYSIFLPLKLGTTWFYTGIAIYLVGLVFFIASMVNIVTTPHGEPFSKGMYRISRHPMTVTGHVMHLGISIATASWVFLLFTVVVIIMWYFLVIPEERGCLDYLGDAYREYMDRTPRWLGIPK
jgi:protein-S-isoprenylcysteine O-methyltransferase Ste14